MSRDELLHKMKFIALAHMWRRSLLHSCTIL